MPLSLNIKVDIFERERTNHSPALLGKLGEPTTSIFNLHHHHTPPPLPPPRSPTPPPGATTTTHQVRLAAHHGGGIWDSFAVSDWDREEGSRATNTAFGSSDSQQSYHHRRR